MNKAYFTFLMVRYKLITGILIGANIGCLICAITGFWADWLFIIQGVTLILWGKSEANMRNLSFQFEHMLHLFTTHNANEGIVPDSDIQGLHVFVRRYPWAMKGVELKAYTMSGERHVMLQWGGAVTATSVMAHERLDDYRLKQLKRLCK